MDREYTTIGNTKKRERFIQEIVTAQFQIPQREYTKWGMIHTRNSYIAQFQVPQREPEQDLLQFK